MLIPDGFGSQRQHAVLVLEHALDEQKRLANDRQPFKIEQVGTR